MRTSASRSIWAARAQALGALIPRQRLQPAVLAWTQAAPPQSRWAIACSGGADSLALLLLVWAHWPEWRHRLWVLHFDHRLRGAAARADAAFCRRVSRALGVKSVSGVWRQAPARASEAAARTARLAFFDRELARRNLASLWLGHHQDDVAETMLMRLARGSGAAGLSAPRPVQAAGPGRVRLRPLLSLKKSELLRALRAVGAPWREDATNGTPDFFRNRVRQRIIPAWAKAAERDAVAGAALSRELLAEDDAALEAWVERLRPVTPAGRLNLGRLREAPRAVVRRALYRWLLANGMAGVLSRQGFEGLLAAVERGRPTRQSMGPEHFAVLHGAWLTLSRAAGRSRGPAATHPKSGLRRRLQRSKM